MKKGYYALYVEIRKKAVFVGEFKYKEKAEALGKMLSKRSIVFEIG